MAAAAEELASIVAAYLRKHGFSKTLAAFLRENGDASEEKDIVDLETLYKLHLSTQVNGNTRTKKSKKTKLDETLEMAKGKEDVRDNEEKVNGGASSKKKKKKTGEKKNLVYSPLVTKTEAKIEDSKKKRKEKNPEEATETIEDLKTKVENCLPVVGTPESSVEEALLSRGERHDSALNKIVLGDHVDNGGGSAIQQEVSHPPKSVKKRNKKEKKEQAGELLAGTETLISIEARLADSTQVSSQEDGMSKKKKKKLKGGGGGGEETKDAIMAEAACKIPINGQMEKLDVMKQSVESHGEAAGCGTSSKKNKKRKELLLEGAGDVNGSLQEPSDAKLEATKNEEELIDSKKQSGKKRKHKEDTSSANGILNQDQNNSTASPEKTKDAGGGEVVRDCNAEKHESESTKTKKPTKTPTNKAIPTGTLAFKRVEVDKVAFSDPRLSDNSYWAKDGAEEGYGARAQEVLELVRGRDFRHEKTKKKRGSYRGGFIGLESHSIKFENSDEDQGCGD